MGRFGSHSHVYGRLVAINPRNIYVGDNVSLNEGVILNAIAPITIGSRVHISSGVIINTTGLNYKTDRTHFAKPVIIGTNVWICSGALINPGVIIGNNAVVGAGAVVTKDVEAGTVVKGIPAI